MNEPKQWHETIKHYDVDGTEYTLIAQIDLHDSGRWGVGYYFQWEDQHSLFQPCLSVGGATLDEAIKNAHKLIDTSPQDEDYLLGALIGVQMWDVDPDNEDPDDADYSWSMLDS